MKGFPAPDHPDFARSVLHAVRTAPRLDDAPYWGFACPGPGGWGDKHTLYVIAVTGSRSPVKIGITHNVKQRLRSLEAGNTHGLQLLRQRTVPKAIARQVEMKIHQRLADRARGREWFDVHADEIVDVLDMYAKRGRQALRAYEADCVYVGTELRRRHAEEVRERTRMELLSPSPMENRNV